MKTAIKGGWTGYTYGLHKNFREKNTWINCIAKKLNVLSRNSVSLSWWNVANEITPCQLENLPFIQSSIFSPSLGLYLDLRKENGKEEAENIHTAHKMNRMQIHEVWRGVHWVTRSGYSQSHLRSMYKLQLLKKAPDSAAIQSWRRSMGANAQRSVTWRKACYQ